MINNEKELLIKNVICEDATIAADLEKCDSVEAFREVFAKRNIELSEDEALELFDGAFVSAESDELDEDALDNVSGGGVTWAKAKSAFLTGARVGIAARMVYDKVKYGNATKTYSTKQLKSGKFWA